MTKLLIIVIEDTRLVLLVRSIEGPFPYLLSLGLEDLM